MADKAWQAVVAGVGGQGVLFVTKMLATAVAGGDEVLISEVHGMAQRGGSVLSHLKVGPFAGPLVAMGRADLLFSLDAGEAVRNLGFLAPGGALVVNAPDCSFLSEAAQKALARLEAQVFCADAAGLAAQAGAPKGVNLALLASAAGAGMLPVSAAQLKRVVLKDSPESRRETNRRLFDLGAGLSRA
jgi:indolepyruvate ferredoxin oxidoreductase beta subunit